MSLKIILPSRITMDFALCHEQDYIFLYGNDYWQRGCFGQAGDLGSQRPIIPNCFCVPTLYKYCANPVFWQNNVKYAGRFIEEHLDKIPNDSRIIVPLRKIGQGHSRCQELAPLVYKYIVKRLQEIATPNIEILWE